jgi:hypothetical protein
LIIAACKKAGLAQQNSPNPLTQSFSPRHVVPAVSSHERFIRGKQAIAAISAGQSFVPVRQALFVVQGEPGRRHSMKTNDAASRRKAPLRTPANLTSNAVQDISGALNALLADVFALYLKTKNFHWHVSGPHFRDYHLMFDEQGDQIFATTDDIAERVRKIGGTTLRSIGHIGSPAAHQRQ